MKFVTSFPLSGNGTDFLEFGYTGGSDDISGRWIAVTICVTGARHTINTDNFKQKVKVLDNVTESKLACLTLLPCRLKI
jgi:hypothetical protein